MDDTLWYIVNHVHKLVYTFGYRTRALALYDMKTLPPYQAIYQDQSLMPECGADIVRMYADYHVRVALAPPSAFASR